MIRRRKRHFHEHVDSDLEILPLMNLFVVLIPMLLLSAVFLELSVIRMGLPTDDAAASEKEESLGLVIAIDEARWVVKERARPDRTVDRSAETAEDELRTVLADVTHRFPSENEVVIESRPTTRYDDIVHVMDVSREVGLVGISLKGAGS